MCSMGRRRMTVGSLQPEWRYMTCLPCSRSIRVDGWQWRVLQPLLGRWTTIRSAADPSLSLGRGRPEERGVPVRSTNEKKIFTTSDALQTTGAKCNHGSASICHRFDSICRQLRCFYSSLQANSVRAWLARQQLVSTLSSPVP